MNNENPVLIVEDEPKQEQRQYRTSGMYTAVIPDEPFRTEPHSRHNPRYFTEVWVDGGRYTGEKLRELRRDGKHR